MLLLNLGNRGLNLWAVERIFIGLQSGLALYETPPGTTDVLNVVFSQPTLASSTFSTITGGGKANAGSSIDGLRIGFTVSSAYTGAIAVSTSDDGITYTTRVTLPQASYTPGTYYWADLNGAASAQFFSVTSAAVPYPVVSDIAVATAIYDLPLAQWNRDTYAVLNNKSQSGHPSTNYFFEKKLTPTITLWPVPDTDTHHLTVYRHRQPQDVGSLTQQLEIPQRWLDGFIWLLSARLCFEIPGVDAATAQMVVQMADKQVFEAEMGETDGAPLYLTPGIGVYSR